MKTAVSLPDDLFDEADRLAKRLGLSRSRLYVRALEELLAKQSSSEVRESYDRVYGEEDPSASRAARAAARASFRRNEW